MFNSDYLSMSMGVCLFVWYGLMHMVNVRRAALTGVPPAQDGGADRAVLLSRHEVLL